MYDDPIDYYYYCCVFIRVGVQKVWNGTLKKWATAFKAAEQHDQWLRDPIPSRNSSTHSVRERLAPIASMSIHTHDEGCRACERTAGSIRAGLEATKKKYRWGGPSLQKMMCPRSRWFTDWNTEHWRHGNIRYGWLLHVGWCPERAWRWKLNCPHTCADLHPEWKTQRAGV